MEVICEDNVAVIEQGIELLMRLEHSVYTVTESQCSTSTIGEHMRHNIDHYNCFIEGYKNGRIDYDARRRSTAIEGDSQLAIKELVVINQQLALVEGNELNRTVLVKLSSAAKSEPEYSHSSVHRELQFLLSHTVHHYAIISALCLLKGVAVAPSFGIAPSTLKFMQAKEEACVQ